MKKIFFSFILLFAGFLGTQVQAMEINNVLIYNHTGYAITIWRMGGNNSKIEAYQNFSIVKNNNTQNYALMLAWEMIQLSNNYSNIVISQEENGDVIIKNNGIEIFRVLQKNIKFKKMKKQFSKK